MLSISLIIKRKNPLTESSGWNTVIAMKQKPYAKEFATHKAASDWMRMKNQACQIAGNYQDIYCVVSGPQGDWVVVDIRTAIELTDNYEWSL